MTALAWAYDEPVQMWTSSHAPAFIPAEHLLIIADRIEQLHSHVGELRELAAAGRVRLS